MFIRLTELKDSKSDYFMALAELYMIMKRPKQATDTYLSAYQSFPDRIDALEQAVELLLRLKDLERAQENFGKLILIDPANTRYLNIFVDLVLLNKNEEEGIVVLEKVNDLYGKSEERLSHIASLYYQSGNPQKATEILNNIRQEFGMSSDVISQLTTIYLEASEYDSAYKYSNEFIEHFSDKPGGYVNRALVAVNLEKYDDAIKVLLPVSEKFFDNYSIQYILGSAYHSLNIEKKAEEYLLRALDIYPESRGVKHTLAIMYDSQQRWEASDSLYTALIVSDSSDAQALNNYAYSLAERGVSLEKALSMALQAIELEPENSAYLDTVGWIYFKKGNLRLSLKYIQESVEIENTNAVVLEHLGDVLTSDNRISEAADYYKKALDLDQNNERLKAKVIPE
jgi:tetratricopeptide (TPR) repeat protein